MFAAVAVAAMVVWELLVVAVAELMVVEVEFGAVDVEVVVVAAAGSVVIVVVEPDSVVADAVVDVELM